MAIFTTIAGWINLIIAWFQQKELEQTAADNAESQAIADHQKDGAQSVADRDSGSQQIVALQAADAAHDAEKPKA